MQSPQNNNPTEKPANLNRPRRSSKSLHFAAEPDIIPKHIVHARLSVLAAKARV